MNKLPEALLNKLKDPLPKEAISQHPTKKFLSTIKAIYVVERLNEVFGIGGWMIHNEVVESDCSSKNIVVKSTFTAPEYGITIPDIFGGNDNPDRGDAYKGACTDALTKIASYLYIGMDVYKGLNDKAEPESKPAPIPPNTEKAELPWMSEKQFIDAKARIVNGQAGIDFMEKLTASLRIKKQYRDDLQKLIANAPEKIV